MRRLLITVAGLALLITGGFFSMRHFVENEASTPFKDDLATIKSSLSSGAGNTTMLIERVLSFVHENSIHSSDSEHQRYAFNTPIVISKLLQVHEGSSNEKPGLTCGPRALAMKAILDSMGIPARLVQVYSGTENSIRGHRLVEVYNPDTSKWEVWDPDYGVIYKATSDGARVDILALVFGDMEHIEPWKIGSAGHGWSDLGMLELKNSYFQAVLFEQPRGGMKDAVTLINTERLDTSKTFSDGQNFEQWAKQHYGAPRLIYLPLQSTE